MNFLNLFNKRRVNLSDMQDIQTFANNTSALRNGPLMSKGLVKANTESVMGYVDGVNYKPANWVGAITSGVTPYTTFNISCSTGYALMAYNSAGDLIIIPPGAVTFTAAPTAFQSSGNTAIPFVSGGSPTLNYYYYVYIASRDVRDATYNRIDKNGNVKYPKQINGYQLYVVENSATPPAGDVLYIGKIKYTGVAMVSADIDQTGCIFAGVYQQNTKIKIDTLTPPVTYVNGETKSLDDHINAIGGGTLSVTNPHAVAASDIEALSAPDLSSIGMFKNGILLPNTYDYKSNTTRFQTKIYNAVGNNYIKLLDPTLDTKLIIRGQLYDISDIKDYNTVHPSGNLAVLLTLTVADSQGWYLVYLDVTTNIPELKIIAQTPDFYQADSDINKIYLGYVYFWNNGTTLKIMRNENIDAVDGDPILPFYTWGSLNPKHTTKVMNEEYAVHSKNLVAYNYRNDQLGDTNNISAAVTSGAGTITMVKATENDPAHLNCVVTTASTATPFTTQLNINTLPEISRGITNRSTRPRLYSICFNYSGADDYNDIRISLDGGTTFPYHLPLLSSGPYQFKITTDTYPTVIRVEFDAIAAATLSSFYLMNLQVVEGMVTSDIQVDDVTYTSEIAFDNTIAKAGSTPVTGAGTVSAVETRITKMNLDGILQIIPFSTKLIQTFATTDTLANVKARNNVVNINTDITKNNNLEIWFVQGSLVWEGITYGDKRHEARIDLSSYGMGTTYKYMFSTFTPITQVWTPALAVYLPTLSQSVNSTYIDIYTVAYNTTSTLGIFNYYGIILVTKLIP